jgi:hypothetical protein
MAHEVNARNTLNDAVIRNGIVPKEGRPEAKPLRCTLVIHGFVSEMFEIAVSH